MAHTNTGICSEYSEVEAKLFYDLTECFMVMPVIDNQKDIDFYKQFATGFSVFYKEEAGIFIDFWNRFLCFIEDLNHTTDSYDQTRAINSDKTHDHTEFMLMRSFAENFHRYDHEMIKTLSAKINDIRKVLIYKRLMDKYTENRRCYKDIHDVLRFLKEEDNHLKNYLIWNFALKRNLAHFWRKSIHCPFKV